MSEAKTLETPLNVSLKLSKLDSQELGSNEHKKFNNKTIVVQWDV